MIPNTMTDIFVPIESDYEFSPVPIIMIDVSGSTDAAFPVDRKNNILRYYEFELAKNICALSGYIHANVICWSSTAKLFENMEMDRLDDIYLDTASYSNGTTLACGFDLLKKEHFSPFQITEVIIITDGEISDSTKTIKEILSKLTTSYKINIRIVAVEPNMADYMKTECRVGNILYRIIADNNLTRLVNRFSIYNGLRTEFLNLSNPLVKEGFAPFQEKMFHKSNMNKFIGYLSENIKRESDAAYIKLAQDLSLTIYHLTKDKSYQFQISIIDVFSGLFNDIAAPNLVTQIRSILLNEVNNHISGKSSTFTDLRKKVHLNIENTKLDLMENTYGSIVDPSNNSEVDNIYKFSFLIKTPEKVILRTSNSENLLGSLNLGCNVYMKAAVDVENIKFPLMFAPNMGSSALQWLKLHYARVLGVSPSNEYIYYYFLIDAFIVCGLNKFTDVAELYLKYVCLVLNDIKFGGDIAVVQDIMSMQDVVPFWVVKNAADYSGVGLLPMTIYYLTFRKFIVDLFVDGASKEGYVDKLRGECEKDVREDLLRHGQDLDKLGWDEANLVLKAAVADSCRIKFVLIDEEEKVIIEAHPFGGKTSKIVCPGRLVTTDILCCEICNRAVTPKRLKSCIENVDLLKNIKPSFYTNSTAHIDLGELDGLNKTPLITPDKFTSDFESFSLSNTMIVDPISAAKMRITNNDEFNKEVWFKYPFLKGINMANVALCGGFVRSILLKQQMKDFDFFFYGIKDDYLPRFKSLLTDLTNALTKHDPQMKFGMFYKPMFNVFELIAFKDPSNHINETFTLDNFDKYPFMSLKRYHTDEKIEPDQYYFEDNDEKGVKMKYRFQFIMCKYNAIQDILNSFDLFPSKVAYDGQRVYFTEKSLIAYRYMINEINLYGGSDLIKHRINKYFKYGFSIVFPKNNRKWATADYDNKYHGDENYRGSNENIGPLKFKVRRCIKNIIYINHGSNYENQLERNETLEKEAMGAAKALYISSLFCSFVSVLRYVKINEIPYEFPQFAPSDLIEADQCLMKNGNVTLNFLDRYETLYKEKDWYKQFYKSVKLINFIGT